MTTDLTFRDAHLAAHEAPGVILFTVSVIADGGTSLARVYSSHPDVYPIGGRKTIDGQTSPIWFDQVVQGGQPFLGRDLAAVREFFFDSAVIESLGCGAIINTPVRYAGQTIGSVNFLDREGAYDDGSLVPSLDITQRLVGALRSAALTV